MSQVSRSQISDEKVILFYFSFKIEIQYTKYITASSQNTYFTLGMWKKRKKKLKCKLHMQIHLCDTQIDRYTYGVKKCCLTIFPRCLICLPLMAFVRFLFQFQFKFPCFSFERFSRMCSYWQVDLATLTYEFTDSFDFSSMLSDAANGW